MIRFTPDTWIDALMRPFAMAAPNGHVYVEIIAPDFHFAIVLLLTVVGAFLMFKSGAARWPRATAALLVLSAISFIPWLLTTGNGRYFLPYLLLAGPLCVGIARTLPVTRSMQAAVVAMTLALQSLAFYQNNPWHSSGGWEGVVWTKSPYFSVNLDVTAREEGVTYVTISSLTFSVVAPQFPASSRWINLAADVGAAPFERGYAKAAAILGSARSLRLLQRTQPYAMEGLPLQPSAVTVAAYNDVLRPWRLALKTPPDCHFYHSPSLATQTLIRPDQTPQLAASLLSKAGFWSCGLVHLVNPQPQPHAPTLSDPLQALAEQAFASIERICPRFFPKGQGGVSPSDNGLERAYGASDSALIFTRQGHVFLKYDRALNPQHIGTFDEVTAPGFNFNCNAIKGRSGLPWEREI